jgi:hypothetical protein
VKAALSGGLRKDGSKVVYGYHRASGVLLKGEPNTQEFLESFTDSGHSPAHAQPFWLYIWPTPNILLTLQS